MKKFVALTLAAIIFFAAGCGFIEPDYIPEQYNLVLILGSRSLAKQLDFSLITDELTSIAKNGGEVYLIANDNSPGIYNKITIPPVSNRLSPANQQRKAQSSVQQLVEKCREVTAQSEESDIYSSTALASRCITNSRDTLIVMDNGLSTSGRISFTNTTPSRIDTEKLVTDALEGENEIDLKACSVKIYGIGEVSGEQAELSRSDYKSLVNFYKDFFSRANGNVAIYETPFSTVEECQSQYPVTICPVTSDIITPPIKSETVKAETNAQDIPAAIEPEPLKDGMIIDIPTTSVGFIPDSAELLDSGTALKALSVISSTLKESDKEIVIVGMTATVHDIEYSKQLSLERAEAVSCLLNKLGVNTAGYTVIGTGFSSDNPFHVKDVSKNGKLIEEKAVLNRTVLIMTRETAANSGLI